MGEMADIGCGGSDNLGSSVQVQGKGSKNKRKLADPSLHNVNCPLSLTEFPPYQLSTEKSQDLHGDVGTLGVGSTLSAVSSRRSQSFEWGDLIACQFEELLLSNLNTIFRSAIKQIVDSGYSEGVALKAISRQGLYHGGKDLVLNIVNDAVDFLKNGKENDSWRDFLFEDLQQLVEYTMVEMVNVLREVKPSLCTPEAMWWLLVCDLNILQACAVEGDLLSEFSRKEVLRECSSDADTTLLRSKPEVQTDESGRLNQNETERDAPSFLPETFKFGDFFNYKPRDPLAPEGSTPGKDKFLPMPNGFEKSLAAFLNAQAAYQMHAYEEKLKSTGHKVHNKKENAAWQKSFHMEKYYKNSGKGALKTGNIATIGGFVVEKRTKRPSELTGVNMKGPSSKAKAKAQSSLADGSHRVSSSTPSAVSVARASSKLDAKATKSVPVLSSTKPVLSAEKNLPSKPEALDFPKISDYYAAIPYDKSLEKYVPQSRKDELILNLVPHLQELENDLQELTDWANQMVTLAARRLNIDKPELKALRQDKQEAEQFKKERTILEENTVKRLLEMESALNSVTSQVESANSTVSRLEVENCLLKKDVEVAKLQASKSASSCKEASEREQKALRDAHSLESQKGLLLEELEEQKRKVAELHQAVGKKKDLQIQIEARWKQEKMAKETLLAKATSLRNEREQLGAKAKAGEDLLRQKAADDAKKHMEGIRRLEIEISKLKFNSDVLRIADLKKGIDGCHGLKAKKDGYLSMKEGLNSAKKVPNSWDDYGTRGLRRERECVMCLSEEMSVVFLPCAHQVLCTKCNELHEKQGMKDCPSCRTPIKWRIQARFARP